MILSQSRKSEMFIFTVIEPESEMFFLVRKSLILGYIGEKRFCCEYFTPYILLLN